MVATPKHKKSVMIFLQIIYQIFHPLALPSWADQQRVLRLNNDHILHAQGNHQPVWIKPETTRLFGVQANVCTFKDDIICVGRGNFKERIPTADIIPTQILNLENG